MGTIDRLNLVGCLVSTTITTTTTFITLFARKCGSDQFNERGEASRGVYLTSAAVAAAAAEIDTFLG